MLQVQAFSTEYAKKNSNIKDMWIPLVTLPHFLLVGDTMLMGRKYHPRSRILSPPLLTMNWMYMMPSVHGLMTTSQNRYRRWRARGRVHHAYWPRLPGHAQRS